MHPSSPFAMTVSITSCCLLLYTAVVVQIEVGFFWNASICESMPTETFDMFVDAFFLFEVLCTFVTGVRIDGVYHDDLLYVSKYYLHNGFLFDVCTSIPVSIIEVSSLADMKASCKDGEPQIDAGFDASKLVLMRLLKPLRLFKLFRLLRASRILSILDRLEEITRPPAALMGLVRLLFMISFVVHSCSCFYWLVKEMTTTEDEYADFLARQGLSTDSPLVSVPTAPLKRAP